jgi:N6-adenosine-specific RNA methylase IME4
MNFAVVASQEEVMTQSLRTWGFPLMLAMVWTLTTAYTLMLAGQGLGV